MYRGRGTDGLQMRRMAYACEEQGGWIDASRAWGPEFYILDTELPRLLEKDCHSC